MFEDETGIARWFLERIKLIYIFDKQYKKDRLSVETIEARRKEDIFPILGEILQELNKYEENAARSNLAFAYSLTQSCKLCNVNPYDYWEDLLTNSCNPNRTIDSFMPHLWRKQP